MENETPLPGTEPANTQDAKKTDPVTTSFGLSSFNLPTPKALEAAFDIYLIVTTAFLSWIAATGLFNPTTTKEIVYIITLLITPIVKGLSKLFGVKVIDEK